MAKIIPPVLYMVINVTKIETTRILFVADNQRAILLGQNYESEHPGQKVIAPVMEARGFSKLDKLALQYLYWNTFQEKPNENYSQLLQDCLTKAKLIEPNQSELAMLNAANITFEKAAAKEENSSTKPPKVPKTASESVPKKTSTCGLVWDLCEKVLSESGLIVGDKALRTLIMKACEDEGINSSTSAVQYGKWSKTKTTI